MGSRKPNHEDDFNQDDYIKEFEDGIKEVQDGLVKARFVKDFLKDDYVKEFLKNDDTKRFFREVQDRKDDYVKDDDDGFRFLRYILAGAVKVGIDMPGNIADVLRALSRARGVSMYSIINEIQVMALDAVEAEEEQDTSEDE